MQRVWAMPSKWTFEVKPLLKILRKYCEDGKGWADPFAGYHSPVEITNDINPDCPTRYHLDAIEFAKLLQKEKTTLKGVVFDPPYSLVQVSRSYKNIGLDYAVRNKKDPTASFPDVKTILAKLVTPGGYVVHYGWNSNAFGKKRGFKIIEILLCSHGSGRNDTIVTVERKVQTHLIFSQKQSGEK